MFKFSKNQTNDDAFEDEVCIIRGEDDEQNWRDYAYYQR